MKIIKLLICFLVLLAVLVIPALTITEVSPDLPKSQNNDREKESTIDSVINRVRGYRKAGKYEEARQVLEESLKKFPGKENRKSLQIELAEVHFWWAKSFEKKYDHANAVTHYEKAYVIDKIYRPKNAYIDLAYIGVVMMPLAGNKKHWNIMKKHYP